MCCCLELLVFLRFCRFSVFFLSFFGQLFCLITMQLFVSVSNNFVGIIWIFVTFLKITGIFSQLRGRPRSTSHYFLGGSLDPFKLGEVGLYKWRCPSILEPWLGHPFLQALASPREAQHPFRFETGHDIRPKLTSSWGWVGVVLDRGKHPRLQSVWDNDLFFLLVKTFGQKMWKCRPPFWNPGLCHYSQKHLLNLATSA